MGKSRPSKRPRRDVDTSLRPTKGAATASANSKTPTGTTIPDDKPDSTPISHRMSGTEKYASKVVDRKALNLRVGNEMSGHWVGPMDPKDFLAEFLPEAGTPRPQFNKQDFHAVATAKCERKMYPSFVSLLIASYFEFLPCVFRWTRWPPLVLHSSSLTPAPTKI